MTGSRGSYKTFFLSENTHNYTSGVVGDNSMDENTSKEIIPTFMVENIRGVPESVALCL